jgi:hypothetical protein
MRQQAPVGVAMASQEEISYTGLRRLREELVARFVITAEDRQPSEHQRSVIS